MLTKLKDNINNKILNFKSLNTKNKVSTIISAILMFACIIACGLLCSTITMIFIDDVMYGDWTHHGIRYFLEKNIWHIGHFNGRTLVHICLQLVLFFKENLYIILMPIMIAIMFSLFFKINCKKASAKANMFAVATCFMLFFITNISYIQTTLLWMAAGFNYLFPLFIISIAYFLFLKNKDSEKISIITILMLLMSGATTEQYGMFTIGLIVLTIFFDIINKKKNIIKNCLSYLLPTIIGYATVILSGGTLNRLTNSLQYTETEQTNLWDGFLTVFRWFIGGQGNIIPVVLFFIVIGFGAMGKKSKYSKLCISAIPVAIISLALYYTAYLEFVYIICAIEFVLLCVALCIKEETREQGKLLICGFGTLMMMIITPTVGTRTALPFVLTIIIITTVILYNTAKRINKPAPRIICILLLLLISYSSFLPMYQNLSDKKVYCESVESQLTNAKDTNVMTVDFDETIAQIYAKYRYVHIFDTFSMSQYDAYTKFFDIPKETEIYFQSDLYDLSSIECEGKFSYVPALNQDGKTYIPIAYLPLIYDGAINENYQAFAETEKYAFDYTKSSDEWTVTNKETNEIVNQGKNKPIYINQYGGSLRYMEINEFCEWLNLSYSYDENKNIFHLVKEGVL